jgi:hypothetical protein
MGRQYHLVFAAFRAHILDFNDLEPIFAMYRTFPRLFHVVRGSVWRVTGSILIVQVFNSIGIATLSAFWRWRFGIGIPVGLMPALDLRDLHLFAWGAISAHSW